MHSGNAGAQVSEKKQPFFQQGDEVLHRSLIMSGSEGKNKKSA
jgi:hypothetical protein